MKTFLGEGPFTWLALVVAAMTLLIMADALAGHYRSGFRVHVQYAPFPIGAALVVAGVVPALSPRASWTGSALQVTGWLAVGAGVTGSVAHHLWGVRRAAGGYRLLLHHLMYGPPPLAPLGLAATGALAVAAGRGLAGLPILTGVDARSVLLAWTAFALIGTVLQSALLHYRGAFNNVFMYAPLGAPLLAAALCAGAVMRPDEVSFALEPALWLTLLTGFVGLGMHLRGFDRQMGGLYLARFNVLEGPPAFSPGLFAVAAAAGIVAVKLL